MDDFIATVAGIAVMLPLILALGGFVLAGFLVYKLFELALVPLAKELCKAAARWYHEVTWKQRVLRNQNEALQAIDAVRHEQVELFRVRVEALERQHEALTAGRTAAVRVAVRGR
jgi:hypothetical protein